MVAVDNPTPRKPGCYHEIVANSNIVSRIPLCREQMQEE
jgi:hypothetical protein